MLQDLETVMDYIKVKRTFSIFSSELDNRGFRYLIGFQIHERGRGPATLAG